MKKIKILVLSMLSMMLLAQTVNAQSNNQKFELGFSTGLNDYHGDLSQKWFDASHAYRALIGLTFNYNINSLFNIGVNGNFGHLGHHLPLTINNSQLGMSASLLHASAQFRLKFNNGYWLKEESKLQPYVYLGTGLACFNQIKNNNGGFVQPGTDWTGNAGAGLTYMINNNIGLNYNLNYAYQNHDKRDGLSFGKNDQFMQHSLGVVFKFGGKSLKDADKDGVKDKKDKCSDTPLNIKVDNKGCPIDSDKDGVPDFQDACPNEVGISENKGCPEIQSGVKDIMKQALEGVQFETGKDVILSSSYSKLDAVAEVMKTNTAYKLDINGHTDNVGEPAMNMTLSKARAESVKRYLMSKGVEANRMKANGFGQNTPKVSNDTPEGKAINRRVEFEIHY